MIHKNHQLTPYIEIMHQITKYVSRTMISSALNTQTKTATPKIQHMLQLLECHSYPRQSFDHSWHLYLITCRHLSIWKFCFSKIALFRASHIDQQIAKKHTHQSLFKDFPTLTSIQDSKALLGSVGITHEILHLLRQSHHSILAYSHKKKR